MFNKTQLEIPYSNDTRLSGRLIALAFFVILFFGIYVTKDLSFENIYEIPITFLFSVSIGLWVFITQNGQKLKITPEEIIIEPDLLFFYKKKSVYKKDELEKIKLCAIDQIDNFARGYLQIVTKKGHKISLDVIFPSQAKYLGEVVSNAFQIPLDTSDYARHNWL